MWLKCNTRISWTRQCVQVGGALPMAADCSYISRHTSVCRAAQEAGAPHRGFIDRMEENVIFTLLYLGNPLSDWN